ncbi:hypothetical protein DB30_02502 [Enhygromyxa salina]|uniref:Tetratricopeptide repeat protein n=1 Tax=Enhygromyxa salina TaxID=215803 RepID=A0A0C1ZK80_9BACT|nr:hypothetical protein [Enhygromyxa salina]KIG17879.1 hypothetical protein DB30_02502 [Enhygromyxa salina]
MRVGLVVALSSALGCHPPLDVSAAPSPTSTYPLDGPTDPASLHHRAAQLRARVEGSPADADLRVALAEVEFRLGDLDHMEADARRAVELLLNPTSADLLAVALLARGDMAGAQAILRDSIEGCTSGDMCAVDGAGASLLWLSFLDLDFSTVAEVCHSAVRSGITVEGAARVACELGSKWVTGSHAFALASSGTAALEVGPRPHEWTTTAWVNDTQLRVGVGPNDVFSGGGPALARALGVSEPTKSEDGVTWIPELRLGTITLRDVPVVLAAGVPDDEIQLALGTQVLRQLPMLEFDFVGHTLTIGEREPPSEGPVPMRWVDRGLLTIPLARLEVEGRPLWLSLDTASEQQLSLDSHEFGELVNDTRVSAALELTWSDHALEVEAVATTLRPFTDDDFFPRGGLGRPLLSTLTLTMYPRAGLIEICE